MPVLHILTPGFESQNGRAFLFPILANRQRLRDRGWSVRLFDRMSAELNDCHVVAVDSKYHRARWGRDTGGVLEEFAALREATDRVLFFDTGDSAGVLQALVLPYVDGYLKSLVYRDRSVYERRLYGNRLFTDFYHQRFGVEDDRPLWSEPVKDRSLLRKIGVSWNSGLADYSPAGLRLTAIQRWRPIPALLRYPSSFHPPQAERPIDVTCRMNLSYARATVAFQRRRVDAKLRNREVGKLPRRAYFREMRESKIVLSPFGWGEINLKDFEIPLCGAVTLKPDMSSIETYPDLFRDGDTILTHRWDLEDLDDVLASALENPRRIEELAICSQDLYRKHLSAAGRDEFVARFVALLTERPDREADDRSAR